MYIRGAYFVGTSSTSNKLIDFFIVNPANKVIFSKRKAEEGIFRFNTTMPGRYSFIFSNVKVCQCPNIFQDRKSLKDVTIAIHTPGTNLEEVEQDRIEEQQMIAAAEDQVQIDDVLSIKQALQAIYKDVRGLAGEAKMSLIRQDGVNQMIEDNNRSSLYGTVVESLVFVGIAAA